MKCKNTVLKTVQLGQVSKTFELECGETLLDGTTILCNECMEKQELSYLGTTKNGLTTFSRVLL